MTNRLATSSSPYLREHAENPVDWYPWSDEAFAFAARERRLVFLSIGYSSCHWCHVMASESFDDEVIARLLNDSYVSIKVDREERPDIDATYIEFVSALTGSAGWPLSVWLLPNREPFFGGTYFPPRAGVRGVDVGFFEILKHFAQSWREQPERLHSEAARFARVLREQPTPPPGLPAQAALQAGVAAATSRFDARYGGYLGAPKFPSFPVRFLLREGGEGASTMVSTTLQHMREGGVYDQLGFGFHRYAVDAEWRVPHFEKMLYDNAQLAVAYLEAGQSTGQALFVDTARETLDYLSREMLRGDGLFDASTSADSEGGEGVFFTWTRDEVVAELGAVEGERAVAAFGLKPQAELDGRSVLTRVAAPDEASRLKLLAARARRPPPAHDDKAIVAWNALTATGFSRTAIVDGDTRFAHIARATADALAAPLTAGRALPHQFVRGQEEGLAFSDDVTYAAQAFLDVFEMTSDSRYLELAQRLMTQTLTGFADPVGGGYFLTSTAHEKLFLRSKADADSPMPSPTAVAAACWLRLAHFTGVEEFRALGLAALGSRAALIASGHPFLEATLLALSLAYARVSELVVVVNVSEVQPALGIAALHPDARPFLDALKRVFVPHFALVVGTEAALDAGPVAWARGKPLLRGKPTAYLCEHGVCQLPTASPVEFERQLYLQRGTSRIIAK